MRLEEAPMFEDSLHELFTIGVVTVKRVSKVRVNCLLTHLAWDCSIGQRRTTWLH